MKFHQNSFCQNSFYCGHGLWPDRNSHPYQKLKELVDNCSLRSVNKKLSAADTNPLYLLGFVQGIQSFCNILFACTAVVHKLVLHEKYLIYCYNVKGGAEFKKTKVLKIEAFFSDFLNDICFTEW